MDARQASSVLKIAVLAAPCFASGAAFAQTWAGGTPYGGTVSVLLQSQDAQTLFAGTNGGLFRTDDGGAHWSRKLAGAPGSGPSEFAGFALSHAQPGRLWLADVRGRIHRSDDNGETIATTTALPVDGALITQLLATSAAGEPLFVATSNVGLWYSMDAGASFSRADTNIDGGLPVVKLIVAPQDPSRFIAFPSRWVSNFYYSFGGTGWNPSANFQSPPTTGVFTNSQGLFVATNGPNHRLWYSHDFFGPWTEQLTSGCSQANSLLLDVSGENLEWLGCDDGLFGAITAPVAPPMVIDRVEAPIRNLSRDRTDTDRLWAASEHVGVFTSTDAGHSWSARNEGLSGTNFRSVAVHPQSHRLYAGYVDESTTTINPSLMFSDDDGATWTASDLSTRLWLTRAIAVDPTVRDIDATPVYAGGVGQEGNGLFKSVDGGRSFSPLGGSSPPYAQSVRDIALDPRSCASPPNSGACTSGPLQTFYVIGGTSSSTTRVLRSDDGGLTLLDRSAGLPERLTYPDNAGVEFIYPIALALDSHDARTLFIGTYLTQSVSNGIAVPTPNLPNGVFRSRDGGSTWQAVNFGLPRNGDSADTAIDVYALATDPFVDGRLWAAGAFREGRDGSRVFRSDDAGDHWTEQAAFAACDIRRLLADPQREGTLHASGTSRAQQGTGCVLRSRDGGESWTRIDSSLPATRVSAMAMLPGAPGSILVGTNTGVWQLRDAPDAIFRNGFD